MTSIAEAFISLRPDHKGFEGEAKKGILGPMKGLALAVGGAFAAAGVGSFLKGAIEEAREAAKVTRLTESVIKSTGGVANVSAGQIGTLADRLSNLAGVDDELIQSAGNVLLTFTKVRNEVGKGNNIFDQASASALDMSAALGVDLQGATLQLGKALNDPIKGISALSRAGVSFTAQQKDQVKAMVAAGDTLGAQKLILSEMQTQFGGAAAAAADPMQKLGVVVGNLKERIGTALLPVLTTAATWLGEKLPGALDTLGRFLGPIIDQARWLASLFMDAARGMEMWTEGATPAERIAMKLGEAFRVVVDFLRDHWQPVLIGVGVVVLGLISPFALVGAALVTLWTQSETFRDIVRGVVDAVVGFWERYREQILGILTEVGEMFFSAFDAVRVVVETAVKVIGELWDRFGRGLVDNLGIALSAIFTVLDGAVQIFTGVFDLIKAILTGKWGEAWDAIKQILGGAVDVIKGALGLAIEAIRVLVESGMGLVSGVWSAAWNGLKTVLSDIWEGIKDIVGKAVKWVLDKVDTMLGPIDEVIAKIGGLFGDSGKHDPNADYDWGGYGGRAFGGPVNAWTPYMVGERGPELFMPKTSGTVVPNDALGGMHVENHFYGIDGAEAGRSVILALRMAG